MAIQDLPKPIVLGGTPATTVAFQQQPTGMLGAANLNASPTYAPSVRKPDGCAFCATYGHCIHDCPTARDYVTHGLAVFDDGRIKLPNYRPVPNDGTGRGIKFSIDQWLATQNTPITPAVPAAAVAPPAQPIAFH